MDTAVAACVKAIERNDRYTGNRIINLDNEEMFRARLESAQRGKLMGGDQLRTVRKDPRLDMFEIRWTDIAAIPWNPVTGLFGERVDTIHVRLYYIEQGEPWVVGLVTHEKAFGDTDAETAQLQDQWIEQAVRIAWDDADDRWAVPELGCRTDETDLTAAEDDIT